MLAALTLTLLSFAPAAQEEPLDPALARHLETLAQEAGVLSPAVWDELVEADHAQVYRAIVQALEQDALPSAVVRGRALRALSRFAVDSAEVDRRENAVQVLYERAISAPTQAERIAACRSLGVAGDFGRDLLMRVVETEPETWLRLAAFEVHAETVAPGDYVTYRELAGFSIREREGRGDGGDTDALLRPTAFAGVVLRLSEDELERALEDEDVAIVESALRLMGERGYPAALELAEDLIEEKAPDGPLAVAAVDIVARAQGTEAMEEFLELAKSRSTSPSVQRRMGEWIAGYRSEYVIKNEVRKRLETARPPQLYFALEAVAKRESLGLDDRRLDQENNEEKLDEALIDLLHHREPRVAALAASRLLRRGASAALEELVRQSERTDSPEVRAVLLSTYASLVEATDREAFEPLTEALEDEDGTPDVVRAAVVQGLLGLEPSIHEELITDAFSSGSAALQLAAIRGLSALGWEDAPQFLVEALPKLRGFVRTTALDSLRLTSGLDLGDTSEAWAAWWEEAKRVRSRGEVEEVDPDAPDEMPDGLTQQGIDPDEFEEPPPPPPSPAEFTVFGRPIDSAALLIAIDGGPGGKRDFASERGRLTHLEAVREELLRWIGNVPEGVLFEILVLGQGEQGRLFGEPRAVDDATRAAAVEFLGGLRARSAAKEPLLELTEALAEPRFDSALVIDFGGLERDPGIQRDEFELWNAHRLRRVHGVSLGRRSGLLSWLSAGTGGQFVYAP